MDWNNGASYEASSLKSWRTVLVCVGCAAARINPTADDPALCPRTYKAEYEKVFDQTVGPSDSFEWPPLGLNREARLLLYDTCPGLVWVGEILAVHFARPNNLEVGVQTSLHRVESEVPDFRRNSANVKRVLRTLNARIVAKQ